MGKLIGTAVSHMAYTDQFDVNDILLDGIITDGAHHKQWFLCMALIKLCGSGVEAQNMITKRYGCESWDEFLSEYGDIDTGIPD